MGDLERGNGLWAIGLLTPHGLLDCMQKGPRFLKTVQFRALRALCFQAGPSKSLGIQWRKAQGKVARRPMMGM